jgi:hypothetical protein
MAGRQNQRPYRMCNVDYEVFGSLDVHISYDATNATLSQRRKQLIGFMLVSGDHPLVTSTRCGQTAEHPCAHTGRLCLPLRILVALHGL